MSSSNQNDVEACADVLVYSTQALTGEVEVTGPMTAVLHVATSAPNTDFTAKLVDVHADGTAYKVAGGIIRRAYQPTADPRTADATPIDGEPIVTATKTAVAKQVIYHDAQRASRLVLPIVPLRP